MYLPIYISFKNVIIEICKFTINSLDYKEYFLECRKNYLKKKPALDTLYKNPLRIINPTIYSKNTIEILKSLSSKVKIDFESGKHDVKKLILFQNIWDYREALQSICLDLIPYLESTMFGCDLYVSSASIYRTKNFFKREGFYLWHNDDFPHETLKAIIYLDKVDENNSPVEFLLDENKNAILAECQKLGQSKWVDAPSVVHENEVLNLTKNRNFSTHKVFGDQFTTIGFLNNTIHRANLLHEGYYRDVINFTVRPTIKKCKTLISNEWTNSPLNCRMSRNPMISWHNSKYTTI